MTLVGKVFWIAKFGSTLLKRGFNSSKCKTTARLATSRIKLLRNKREAQIKQMRRDVALLLRSGQDATARIRVEHVIREQNAMAANDIIELFCELVVVRMSIISKQKMCPADLKEGISSLIFAAPRCSDIPELLQIRDIFEKKYGKDFASAAAELRPDCGVNRLLIEKLSVKTRTGETKLKVMKEIAKEYQIEWDTKESELELLKAPEETIVGPQTFISSSSMQQKSVSSQAIEPNPGSNKRESYALQFKDSASAADSAEKAVAAAQAAAHLDNQSSQTSQPAGYVDRDAKIFPFSSNNDQVRRTVQELHSKTDIKFDDSDGLESDVDEEIQMGTSPVGMNPLPPPDRLPPQLPSSGSIRRSGRNATDDSNIRSLGSHIHPKLPDYDSLAARFESLKHNKT